jgi:hypothetical protein
MNGTFYDETGELVTGLFYQLDVANDVEFAALGVPGSAEWIKSGIDDEGGGNIAYLEPVYEVKYQCKLNPRHETDREISSCACRFYGQTVLRDFMMDPGGGLLTVTTEALAKRIIDQGFNGVTPKHLKIIENQSEIEAPRLVWLQFSRHTRHKPFVRRNTIRLEEPNACPFCGWGPVVCPSCGDITYDCERCKERILVPASDHKGADDKRWTIQRKPAAGTILEGKHWNGNDFVHFGSLHFVSKRVVDWLLRVHAAPFIAKPARVDVTGMTPEQRAKLDAVTKLE